MRWDQGALQRFRSIVGSSLGLLGADRLIDRQDRHAGRKGRLRCVVRDALLCFEDSGVSAFLALPPLVCRKCVCWGGWGGGGYSLESTRTGKKHRSQEYFSPAFWTAQGGECACACIPLVAIICTSHFCALRARGKFKAENVCKESSYASNWLTNKGLLFSLFFFFLLADDLTQFFFFYPTLA